MSRVLFIQNGETDAPGIFQQTVEAQGSTLQVVHAWRGEPVPTTAQGWDGVVVGGGGMSAYEQTQYPWLTAATTLLQDARATGVPTLGMCLGAQLQAQAWGGEVYRNTAREIGFFPVRFTPAAEADPIWRTQAPTPFAPVHWHQDVFTLPPGAVALASSELTPHQLFRLEDRHYGLQFHLEMDGPVLERMIAEDAQWLSDHGVDPQAFLADSRTHLPLVEQLARDVFQGWLRLLPPST